MLSLISIEMAEKDWIELSTDGYYPNKTRSEVEFEIKSDKGISNAYLGIIDLDGNNSGTKSMLHLIQEIVF